MRVFFLFYFFYLSITFLDVLLIGVNERYPEWQSGKSISGLVMRIQEAGTSQKRIEVVRHKRKRLEEEEEIKKN